MAFIEWSDRYNIEIDSIDKQHRQLIAMINDLNKGIADGETLSVLANIFDRLTDYIVRHFRHEEALFEQYAYPQAEAHQKSHEEFIQQIGILKDEFESDPGGGTAVELMHYLYHWLIDHIQYTDKAYAKFMREKGVH